MSAYAINPESTPPIDPTRIRTRVRPEYSDPHSAPPDRYVFVYHVTIENVGDEVAQLFWRHWLIHDSTGGDSEVQGEGVVGESPVLRPGDVHAYQSFCVLQSPVGHMEGYYHFRRPNGAVFRAEIPRFYLHAPTGPAVN